MGRKNPLKVKRMFQIFFRLKPTVLLPPEKESLALEKQNLLFLKHLTFTCPS
jgi:hypothetical protein